MHDEWTQKAADHGKHILCEKPLTVTAAESEKLVAYCRSKGVRLMDGFMWPHHPRTHKLRKFLDSGAIGEVKKVIAAFTFDLAGLPTTNIRMQPQAGGGGLLDVGCYTTYGIRWWMHDEPVSVFAKATYVPVGFLFLEEPPVERIPIPDFRTVGNAHVGHPSPDLLDMVYLCQQRQEWYREFARSMGEAPVACVGSVQIGSDVETAAATVSVLVE